MSTGSPNFLRSYFTSNMLLVFILGFASGLPIVLILSTLQAFLRDYGVSYKTVGLITMASSAYSLKVLWAPFLDSIKIPYLTDLLGRRRSWLLLIQILLIISIYMLGNFNPKDQILIVVFFTISTAFLSASQDIVIDALRIDKLKHDEQGHSAAVLSFSYRVAMLLSSAGPLIIAELYSWRLAYAAMSIAMIPPLITTLLISEPKSDYQFEFKFKPWFQKACAAPFIDFFSKAGSTHILLFVLFYKMSDAFIAPMLMPFYMDLGFTKIEIAKIVKIYGFVATIFGGFVSGYFVDKINIYRSLFWGVLFQISTNLIFIAMYYKGHDIPFLMIAISLENFASGFSSVILVAFLSRLCNKNFSATQYALFSAVAASTRSFLSGFSGFSVEMFGWSEFFTLSCLLSMPSFVFLYLLKNRDREVIYEDKLQNHKSI